MIRPRDAFLGKGVGFGSGVWGGTGVHLESLGPPVKNNQGKIFKFLTTQTLLSYL